MTVLIMVVYILGVHKTLPHMFSTYYSCYIVHVETVMAIVLLCENAQQFRALMMIL